MPSFDTAVIVLAGIALFAAFINGALGYGFSSLTVPVALVFYANRVLNPAVVVIEVFLNLYVLFMNLSGVWTVWKRVVPIVIGLSRHRDRCFYSCIASTRLDQAWNLYVNSAPDPAPGGRLAKADPGDLAGQCPFWISAGHPVFGNDHFRPPFSNLVQ